MKIHLIKIIPGTIEETRFKILLQEVGAIPELVLCRTGAVFNTRYDEYVISEGLYRQISEGLNRNG